MSNSIFEDALLLAAGGIVGLIAGAALMSDDEDDDDEEEEARIEPKAAAEATETETEASDRFVELGKDGKPQPDESFAPKPAQRFQDLAAKLEQALDETLADLPPVTSRPSAPATCGDS